MNNRIPQGNTLRDFKRILADAGAALGPIDVYPSTPVERAADRILRKARARPVAPRPRPWWVSALFLAAAFFAGAGLALIVADMVQTGAATAVHAKEMAGW